MQGKGAYIYSFPAIISDHAYPNFHPFINTSSQLAKSQNIYSALQLNQDREYKTKKPKKILETNTFYNTSGKQVDRNVKTFDDTGILLMEERYDDNGILRARLTYTNDTINRVKLTRTFERWSQFGFSKETAFYNYNTNHFLISTTDKDAIGNTLRHSDIVCNDKGHPIQLSLSDGNGSCNKALHKPSRHYSSLNSKNTATVSGLQAARPSTRLAAALSHKIQQSIKPNKIQKQTKYQRKG